LDTCTVAYIFYSILKKLIKKKLCVVLLNVVTRVI